MEEKRFIEILNKELVKSLGCTEPIAITYAVALARRQLGTSINKVNINASRNLIKNAMGVSIPGTKINEINLSSALMAGALGIIKPDIEKNLEILNDIKRSDIENAKELISEGLINIELHDSKSNLYLEVIIETKTSKARVVVENSHTNVVLMEVDGKIIKETPMIIPHPTKTEENMDFLNMDSILKFVDHVDVNKLEIIKTGIYLNKKICEEGLKKSYGLNVGKNIESNISNGFFSIDIISKAISLTAAGSDARMSGCTLPAMSNSGSGNQGISATMPVVVVAEQMGIDPEKKVRAVTLSNLITIYVKSFLGRLSAMCGAIISSMGACCGITYILGGGKREIESALQLMMANVTGMICDGAKSGCALKVSTCTYAAFHSALLAVSGVTISEKEGIIENNLEKTIENFSTLAKTGMKEADRLILEMMLQKTY